MPTMLFDFTPDATPKQRLQLQRRLARLQVAGYAEHLARVHEEFLERFERKDGGRLRSTGLRLRPAFSCLSAPIEGDYSDRRAPPRDLRPPATRISSSRGSTLRFELTVLAALQLYRRPGARAKLAELQVPIDGGWSELVATLPLDSNVGGSYYQSRDKRARAVKSALEGLAAAGLVDLPGKRGERNRYEGFVPLFEVGEKARGSRDEYCLPRPQEHAFTVPAGFVLRDWMHLLEDSEIAVLLMVACGEGADVWGDDGLRAIAGETRLRQYGIHRGAFSDACKTLVWFGLLEARAVNRHYDGKAEDGRLFVHRLGLNDDAFDQPALPTLTAAIKRKLDR